MCHVLTNVALHAFGTRRYRLAPAFADKNEANDALFELQEKWEDEVFIPHCVDLAAVAGTARECRAHYSFNSEFDRAVSGDTIFFVGALAIMMVYCIISLGKINSCVEGRKFLAAMGIVSVLLAIGVAIGLGGLLGVGFTSVTQIVPFLALGVGVDDMYVLMRAYDQTAWLKGNVELRTAKALQQGGGAIMVTSLTSMLAFACGASTVIPAIRWYCINLAIAVLFDFLNQVTFFVAFMYLDGKRLERRATDCCCCCGGDDKRGDDGGADAPKANKVLEHRISQREAIRRRTSQDKEGGDANGRDQFERPGWGVWFVEERYGPFLMMPSTKAAVFFVFIGSMAGAAYGITQLTAGFDNELVLPDDSYLAPFYNE